MANFRQLEPGNWQFDLGDEYFTPSRTVVDPVVPLLPLETPAPQVSASLPILVCAPLWPINRPR